MIEFRCKQCRALLMKESIRDGEVEVKCSKCNTFNTLDHKTRYHPVPVDSKKKNVHNKENQ